MRNSKYLSDCKIESMQNRNRKYKNSIHQPKILIIKIQKMLKAIYKENELRWKFYYLFTIEEKYHIFIKKILRGIEYKTA